MLPIIRGVKFPIVKETFVLDQNTCYKLADPVSGLPLINKRLYLKPVKDATKINFAFLKRISKNVAAVSISFYDVFHNTYPVKIECYLKVDSAALKDSISFSWTSSPGYFKVDQLTWYRLKCELKNLQPEIIDAEFY